MTQRLWRTHVDGGFPLVPCHQNANNRRSSLPSMVAFRTWSRHMSTHHPTSSRIGSCHYSCRLRRGFVTSFVKAIDDGDTAQNTISCNSQCLAENGHKSMFYRRLQYSYVPSASSIEGTLTTHVSRLDTLLASLCGASKMEILSKSFINFTQVLKTDCPATEGPRQGRQRLSIV